MTGDNKGMSGVRTEMLCRQPGEFGGQADIERAPGEGRDQAGSTIADGGDGLE
jgi:hypothetical protein